MTARSTLGPYLGGRTALVACAVLGAVAVASPAQAQPKPSEVARAAALVARAQQRLATNDLDEACALFGESYGADPQVGTLFDLAICHEKAGRIASAFVELTSVAAMATRAGQSKRAEAARERARQLEPRLSRVLFEVHERDPGLVVKVDGRALVASDVRAGVAIPVDPGPHVVTASAPGKTPWRSTLGVAPGPNVASFEVPALDDAAPSEPPPVSGFTPSPSSRTLTRTNRPLRTFAWVAGAGAASGLVVGGVGLGVSAAADDASPSWRTVSTVGFVTGGLLAVTSAVLFLLSADSAPRIEARAPAAGFVF
ncbi:MAG TPA: hypothetical protein VLT33_05105 [Labilithrix sp.]|nr:hypothetical protein [Labilithrix sp.]